MSGRSAIVRTRNEATNNELLLKLEQVEWFSNCEKPLEANPEVQVLSGWPSVMEVSFSQPSEDARLEAQNELSVQLDAHHREAYQTWNSKIREIRPLIDRLVRTKLATPAVQSRIPRDAELYSVIRWDLVGLCMAHEYEDLVGISKYYELIERFYLIGRFPCGWVGEVPDDMQGAFQVGKLAVL
jgi:hypothetical protein